MNTEPVFRGIFSVLFSLLFVSRLYFHWKARTWERGSKKAGSTVASLVQFVGPFPTLGGALLYIFRPEWMEWSALALPDVLRWCGAILAATGYGLLVWVQTALGTNFSSQLRIRADHVLITNGPYRWIRHPMYTTLMMLSVGFFFLSANWFIGGTMIGGIAIVMLVRTPVEERLMVSALGDQYLRYMRQTGRYLPRFRRLMN